jgi:hypothetical protein
MSADGGQRRERLRRERLRLELRLIEGELRTDEALRIPIHRHPSVTANHAAAMASLNPPIGCPHSPERSRSSPAVTQTRPPFHRSVAFPMSIIARTPAKPRETSQNLAKVATGQFSPSNRPNFDPPPYSRWCEKPPQTLWGGYVAASRKTHQRAALSQHAGILRRGRVAKQKPRVRERG